MKTIIKSIFFITLYPLFKYVLVGQAIVTKLGYSENSLLVTLTEPSSSTSGSFISSEKDAKGLTAEYSNNRSKFDQ